MQAAQSPASSLHSKLAASLALNSKPAEALLLRLGGPFSIVVAGGSVSIVQVKATGADSPLPARSVARTWNVCCPSSRPAYSCPLEHGAHSPASSRHSKVAASFALNSKLGARSLLGSDGALSIVVTGATVSTVHA